jgi:hypothetical protein
MTDQFLNVLKIAFLVLLYLFFIRVLWVVANEVRATKAASVTGGRPDLATAASITPDAPAGPPTGPVWIADDPDATQPAHASAPSAAVAVATKKSSVNRLVVIEPRARRGSSYGLAEELVIGRSPSCDLVITDDSFISNLHARVVRDGDGKAYVEDLGSTNGTFLNTERLREPQPLGPGDRVQVGNTVLEAR